MKKKLIAIVASLAMVATMVPASAFAAVPDEQKVPVKDLSGISIRLPLDSQYRSPEDDAWKTQYTNNSGQPINTDVNEEFDGTTLTLTGTVPYTSDLSSMFGEGMNSGNYVAVTYRAAEPAESYVKGWAITYDRAGKDGTTSVTRKMLYTYSYEDAKGSGIEQQGSYDNQVLRLSGQNASYTIYYLNQDGLDAFKAKTAVKNAYTSADDKKIVSDLVNDVNGVVGSKTVTVDTSGLTLLTKAQTESKQGFVNSVKKLAAEAGTDGVYLPANVINTITNGLGTLAAIGPENKVTTAYRQQAISARSIYANLDAATKKVVDDAVAAKATTETKQAYKALEQAEKNIAAYDTLKTVATQIAALPASDTLDLNNEEVVKQVKAAQEAVKDLPAGAEKVLLATTDNDFLTQPQVKNYNEAVAKVENKDVQAVIDAINKLPKLPEKFADKAGVDTVYNPLEAVNKAIKDVDAAKVTNKPDLDKYNKDYADLIKEYVDPIYAEAAKIDVEQPLTAENIALISELKAYVEGEYIETKEIEKFKQATYDALVAALDKAEKDGSSLENATIAAIADQAYTGKAIEPAVTVTDQAGNEVAAEDYTIIYSNNKDAGTATVTVAAKSSSAYTGSVSATFNITPAALTADMVTVANATYTGKAVKPAVSVKGGVDYTVAYRNNTAVGKASAVVTGTGNYTGTITKNFIVKPAKESITSLKAGKKQITVAYKAQTGAKYRVICKASGLKAIGTNTTATKKTVKKLKSGKTYQVKVRAYKTVDGTPYYGAYSAVKKIKVK